MALSGGIGFSQSVTIDLVQNNGDWGQVDWRKAFAMGVVGGALKGIDIDTSKIKLSLLRHLAV